MNRQNSFKIIFAILAALAAFTAWQFEIKTQDDSKDMQISQESNDSLHKYPVKEDTIDLLDECKKGNISACNEGWDTYYNFDDAQKAVEFAKIACEHGDMSSCTTVGNAYEYAYKLLRYDPKQAYTYYNRACDGGNKNACERLRVFSSNGKTIVHNTKPRQKELQSQCDEGDTSACTDLGMMYEKGMGLKKNYDIAAKYYQLGCKQPIDHGCEEGTRLGTGEYYE